MVPSVPGIPGPSSPQPVQSEAKMVRKILLIYIFLEPFLNYFFLLKPTSGTQLRSDFIKLWTVLYTMKEPENLEEERRH